MLEKSGVGWELYIWHSQYFGHVARGPSSVVRMYRFVFIFVEVSICPEHVVYFFFPSLVLCVGTSTVFFSSCMNLL